MRRLPHASHASHRTGLRTLGLALTLVGGAFTAVGLVSFFGAFGGGDAPRLFWCAFVGLPLLGVGVSCLKAGYLGSIARYVASETAPVAADTIDYVAKETQDAVRTAAAAVADGLRGGAAAGRSCPSCQNPLAPDANFCGRCGKAAPAIGACARCRGELRPGARFCDACGAPVGV